MSTPINQNLYFPFFGNWTPPSNPIKETLESLQGIFSPDGSTHPLTNSDAYDKVYAASKLIKKIEPRMGKEESLEELKSLVLSLKIGREITPEILRQHPDFVQFIKVNHWHNKAYAYNQVLPLIDGEPGIFFEGNRIKFSTFLQMRNSEGKLFVDPESKKLISDACIIQEGVVSKTQYNTKEIFPHKKEDPSAWGNQYIFEIVTFNIKKQTIYKGNHTILRLKTADGDVYSWGIIRPNITKWQWIKQRGTMMLNGVAVCPDPYETVEKNDYNIKTTPIAITKEQFEAIKGNLNSLNQKGIPFSAITGLTCQGHVVHQAEKLGINIKSKMTVATLVGKVVFGKKVQHLWKAAVPKVVRTALTYIADFFFGLLLRFVAIHAKDSKVSEVYGNEYDKYLTRFFNIFKPVSVEHPLAMQKWQDKVEKFRSSEEGQKLGPYALPPECFASQKV